MSGLSHGGWALVGLGRIARAHLEAAKAWGTPLFGAAVEPLAANAEGSGIDHVWPTVQAMLDDVTPVAAVVCTPPGSHREVVSALIDAGVHVLVEKPLAATSASARDLVSRAKERGVVLQTAAKFLQMASIARARQLIDDGAIGRLVRVENTFAGVLDPSKDWHGDVAVSGGGVLMDNGPHSINVITALAGPVDAVRTVSMERRQGAAVEDAIELELRCGAATGHIVLSWNEGIRAPIARAVGTDGTLVLDWKGQHIERGGAIEPFDVDGASGYDKVGCFEGVLRSFAAAIAEPPAEAADPDGARVLAVIEAAYRSGAGGAWEAVS